MKPQISIIIVNYNGWYWLEKCLESFDHLLHREEIETIVVDNGSTDDSVGKIQKHFSAVKLIALKENLGFAGGNNVGIQVANAPYIMLFNSDTEFFPETNLRVLLDVFNQEGRVAVVTPKLVLDSGEIDHACHRGFPTPWNAFTYFSGLARWLPGMKLFTGYEMGWKNLSERHEIEACSGAAMVVKREAIDDVGLLDESYFMYGEDIDWCYRFKQKAWKVIYEPAVTVLHHKHKSGLGKVGSWETKLRTTEAFFDAMKQFIRKFYSEKYPLPIRLVIFSIIDTMKHRRVEKERKRYVSQ